MEIIDVHAHVYPDKLAEKATGNVCAFYNMKMVDSVGSTQELLQDGKQAGISRRVIHSVATSVHQVRSINEFIKREKDAHPELIGFITLHPDLTEEEVSSEVAWALKNGFKGVKLHPDFQTFYIDEDRAHKLYTAVGESMPILFHVGDDRYDYSAPKRLVKIAKQYPQINFIAAHFGGYRRWQDVEIYKGVDNIYFDTSSSIIYIGEGRAREIIDMLGVERFFFGTDFPMWQAEEELNRFNKIPLTETERKMILSENIKKLLGI